MKKRRKKKIKRLRNIVILIVFILFIELCYVLYTFLVSNEKNIYFDGVNSYVYSNSNYVLVGSNNDNEKHHEKAKLSVLDSNLDKTKEKLYNKGFNSTFFGVVTDKDSFIAVGSYESNKDEYLKKNRRGLIVKYDSEGNVIFEKDLNDLANSSLNNIKLYDNNYYVCGNSNYSSNDITNDSNGGAYLLKYDTTGKLIWKRNMGDKSSAKFNDLIIVDNYIYACGINNINVGVIAKYDLNGNFITSYDYRNTDNLGFSSIIYRDGYLYICGSKKIGNYNKGVIVRFDTNLSYIDEVSYNEPGNSRYNGMVFDDDHLIVIGTVNGDDYDGIICKYGSNLEYIDAVQYGDDEDDYFTDINVVDDKYIVSGYSSYEDSLLTKFISYSDALKVLEVK